jgi:hypothetical protein
MEPESFCAVTVGVVLALQIVHGHCGVEKDHVTCDIWLPAVSRALMLAV